MSCAEVGTEITSQESEDEDELGPGTVVTGSDGRCWRVEAVVGAGSCCTVWRVHLEGNEGMKAALKIYKYGDVFSAAANREKLLIDLVKIKKGKLPQIVDVLDKFSYDRQMCLIQTSLEANVRQIHEKNLKKPLSLAVIQNLLSHLLRGLAALHDVGFVHADLKPENLLWDPQESALAIIDFGLSFHVKDKKIGELQSPGYRAPEVQSWNDYLLHTDKRLSPNLEYLPTYTPHTCHVHQHTSHVSCHTPHIPQHISHIPQHPSQLPQHKINPPQHKTHPPQHPTQDMVHPINDLPPNKSHPTLQPVSQYNISHPIPQNVPQHMDNTPQDDAIAKNDCGGNGFTEGVPNRPEMCEGCSNSLLVKLPEVPKPKTSADMWSVGCIVLDLVHGKKFFSSERLSSRNYRMKSKSNGYLPQADLEELVKTVFATHCKAQDEISMAFTHLRDLCIRLLHEDPTKRPSASEALQHTFYSSRYPLSHRDQLLLPSPVLRLENALEDRTYGDQELSEILEEISEECQDYGPVANVCTFRSTVLVEFALWTSAVHACEALFRKKFEGRRLTVSYFPLDDFRQDNYY